MISKRELDEIHRKIPVDYYEAGIKNNFLQRYWHGRRYNAVAKQLKKLSFQGKILDIGCHGGDFTNFLHQQTGLEVYGVDISEKSIDYARKRFPYLNFAPADFPAEFPFDGGYSVVTMFDVLEHIPDVETTILKIKSLLSNGGYLIVGIPNENMLFKTVWHAWTAFKGNVWLDAHVHDFRVEGFEAIENNNFKKIAETKIIFGMWWLLVYELK